MGVVRDQVRMFAVALLLTSIGCAGQGNGTLEFSSLNGAQSDIISAKAISGDKLANEGESFFVVGPMLVRYGANGHFFEKELSGPAACTNETFGDPIFGTVKSCFAVAPSGRLAGEGESFAVDLPTLIRYGTRDKFVERIVHGKVDCANGRFGDPVVGEVKECRFVAQSFFRLAGEGESFEVVGPTTVRYGVKGRYVEKLVNGHVQCTNAIFGDPAYGVVKECLKVDSAAPQPEQMIAQMALTTANSAPIDSKDNYVDTHITIAPNGTSPSNAFEVDAKVKGRGNFTWTLPKKPYKIKLASKMSVMGMPADTEWVLLANYVDKTLIRTSVVFEMSRRLGVEYTPRGDFIDLTLNGVSQGSYMLTEQIKIAPDRVNITKLKASDISGEAVTGGYLIEINERLDEVVNWRSARGVPYTLKEPSEPPPEQAQYIKDYINAAEPALYSEQFADPQNGYAQYIDVESFINLFLLQELFKNKDAANFSSINLFKERNQKLKMGPAWDFDLAGGNSNSVEANNPEGWWLRTGSPWYSRLFEDPAFRAKVKARWNAIKVSQIDSLGAYIDQAAYRMAVSQRKNFNVWSIMGVPVFGEVAPLNSYEEEVLFFKKWLQTRAAWMDREINED